MTLPPRGHLQYLGASLVLITGGVGVASGISWVETWDAAEQLAILRALVSPHPSPYKELSGLKCQHYSILMILLLRICL